MAVAALIISILALPASVGSVIYTRKQANSQADVARIERERRYEEQPDFEIAGKERATTPGQADLEIRLVRGPQELDEVTVEILDETGQDHWAHGLPDGVSQQEAELFVWGPGNSTPGPVRRS